MEIVYLTAAVIIPSQFVNEFKIILVNGICFFTVRNTKIKIKQSRRELLLPTTNQIFYRKFSHTFECVKSFRLMGRQGFIQALLLTSVFPERFSFMNVGHNPTCVSTLSLADKPSLWGPGAKPREPLVISALFSISLSMYHSVTWPFPFVRLFFLFARTI